MKKLLCTILVIAVLDLTSCSSIRIDGDSAFDGQEEKHDYLVYQIAEHDKRQLRLYDPVNGFDSPILSNWDIEQFSLASNNRLAFSLHDGNGGVYVLDYPFQNSKPIEIPADISIRSTHLSWSPDGHYLLFSSVHADSKTLSLWDGKRTSDILEYYGKISEVTWSPDDHLAFTEFYNFYGLDPNATHEWGSSKVFIWDGNTIASVSQNPSGEDRFPAWNKDGKLAFFSSRNGENDVFVWDGISKKNGMPDIKTFTNIARDFTQYYSVPTWTSSNTLAFSGGGTGDSHIQIYEWNGQTATNISQNPLSNNAGQTWRNDGYWSFVTYYSEGQDLYIRDATNHTVLITKGQYPPAWSRDGLLAFCHYDSSDWILSIWNGVVVVEIARGDFIQATWKNGESVFCSSG